MNANRLKVLFVASECVPFVKTGGLADVAGALPKALAAAGADVRVVLPYYKHIRDEWDKSAEKLVDAELKLGWRKQYLGVKTLFYGGIRYYFIDNLYYFGRDYIYGVFDTSEAERFGFFSKAVLEMLPHIGFYPDVMHLNDWQSGMTAALLRLQYGTRGGYDHIRTVFTIHNLRFQGVFERGFVDELLTLGAPCFDSAKLEYYSSVNYLKAGLVYSDAVTTVSPTYASEIKTRFYGETLEGVVRSRANSLHGILNGIDAVLFDPATDGALAANYSAAEPAGKAECRKALEEELGLEPCAGPLAGMVSRLTGQKGLDLIERVLPELMATGMSLAVLGTGEARYERLFTRAQSRWPGRIAARTEYNDGLARRIYAGADVFLMPSLFEPCGLSQLIAMRYGAVPVVRLTGGLRDTVEPFDEKNDSGAGFAFENYNAHELLFAVERAAALYGNKALWARLMRRAMEKDFSWDASAGKYMELYLSL